MRLSNWWSTRNQGRDSNRDYLSDSPNLRQFQGAISLTSSLTSFALYKLEQIYTKMDLVYLKFKCLVISFANSGLSRWKETWGSLRVVALSHGCLAKHIQVLPHIHEAYKTDPGPWIFKMFYSFTKNIYLWIPTPYQVFFLWFGNRARNKIKFYFWGSSQVTPQLQPLLRNNGSNTLILQIRGTKAHNGIILAQDHWWRRD